MATLSEAEIAQSHLQYYEKLYREVMSGSTKLVIIIKSFICS